MAIPFQSILDKLMSQIRDTKGSAGGQGDPSGLMRGSFRPMTDQEKGQRGIDPRDPNQYSINEEGQTLNTLIGWNPNQKGEAPFLSGFEGKVRNLAEMAAGQSGGSNTNKTIPKAKSDLQRVSPGMYRNAQGNLVRK